jgi:hypothetical protein
MIDVLNATASNLSAADGFASIIPLLAFVVGISIYALFIFKFYRFLGTRNIFELKLSKHSEGFTGFVSSIAKIFLYLVEYLFILPVFIFFWFLVFVVILIFMAKAQPIQNILLVSMALVGSVRITVYFSEDLARDLAKMLPFAMLGVFLLDFSYFSLSDSWLLITQLPSAWSIMLYYFLLIITIEFIFRILYLAFNKNKK